jgi:AcrR family transcriptional regulator
MVGARDCIVELGYAGTSMSAIAERAGVTRGALQHHYGSRTDVLKALVDHFFASLPELKGPSPDADSEQEIREFLAETFRVYGTRIAAAIMQLRIGAQAEPELQDVIEARFAAMDPMREKVWSNLFRRAGLSAAEANRMREVVYAFLRGLAVRQAYLKRSYGVAAELSMITEMVSLYIDQRTAQAEGSNTRARGRKPRRMPSAGAVQRQRSG